jgi:hypothetical protein
MQGKKISLPAYCSDDFEHILDRYRTLEEECGKDHLQTNMGIIQELYNYSRLSFD